MCKISTAINKTEDDLLWDTEDESEINSLSTE